MIYRGVKKRFARDITRGFRASRDTPEIDAEEVVRLRIELTHTYKRSEQHEQRIADLQARIQNTRVVMHMLEPATQQTSETSGEDSSDKDKRSKQPERQVKQFAQ